MRGDGRKKMAGISADAIDVACDTSQEISPDERRRSLSSPVRHSTPTQSASVPRSECCREGCALRAQCRLLAARFASEFCCWICPPKTEGTGNAGCWPHPWPACNKKAGGSHHRFSRDNRHSPRNGFNGCFAFSPVRRAFWPPSSAQCASIVTDLIPASGYRDHAT